MGGLLEEGKGETYHSIRIRGRNEQTPRRISITRQNVPNRVHPLLERGILSVPGCRNGDRRRDRLATDCLAGRGFSWHWLRRSCRPARGGAGGFRAGWLQRGQRDIRLGDLHARRE